MRPDERRDASIAAVAAMLLAAFFIRIGLGDPGLIELVPVLFAAVFLGRRTAAIVAVAASIVLVAATLLQPQIGPVALVVQVALLFAPGQIVARLAERVRDQQAELRNLRVIQDVLAPIDPPDLPLLDVATRYVPAERGVAGDFYLIAEGRNKSTIFVVGDVAGKGMEAAKRATFVRATLTACAHYSDDPVYLLRMANAELIRQHGVSQEFVTLLCVVVQPDGTVVWSTAGHPPPVSLADGESIGSPRPAYPLGIAPELTASPSRARLPQEGILLYTDGLLDARPPGRNYEPFGARRLANALSDIREPTPDRVVATLEEVARRFARGSLPDDLCLVAVRSRLDLKRFRGGSDAEAEGLEAPFGGAADGGTVTPLETGKSAPAGDIASR